MRRVERDAHGRIRKGSRSLNPMGRPAEPPRLFTSDQLTKDFLELLDEPVTVKIDGREQRMPAIVAIYRRMVHEAASGKNWQAVKKVVELREKYIHARTEVLENLLRRATGIRRHYQEREEEIPDHLWELVSEAERAVKEGQFSG
jgi:hypothetical protein